jgi:choline kinase
MILIYLAAGRGSRLPDKFRNNPKCLVKIKGQTLLERNKKFFKNFKKKIIITGYKKKKLNKIAKNLDFKIIHNKDYKKTNMVHSMFLARKYINKDVVVCYGDIIFDPNIIKLLKVRGNILPANQNWLKYWKKRMSAKKILTDAEELKIKNKRVTHIGGKILIKYPKYQFCGILKFTKKKYLELSKFFKSQNKKLDMTSFLNESIKRKHLKINIAHYKSYWHEIDEKKDIIIAQKSNNFK